MSLTNGIKVPHMKWVWLICPSYQETTLSRYPMCLQTQGESWAKGGTYPAAYKRLHLFSIKRCHRLRAIVMHGKTPDD